MKKIAAFICACAVLALSALASAVDTKTMPASLCRPSIDWFTQGGFNSPATGQPLASPPQYGLGVNSFYVDPEAPYPAIVQASCSLTRDYVPNTNGLSFVKVWVVDTSSTSEVRCIVTTHSPNLSQIFYSQYVGTGVSFVTTPGQSTLLNFTSAMLTQTWVKGYVTVTCEPHPGDVLRTLNWQEYGPGDFN